VGHDVTRSPEMLESLLRWRMFEHFRVNVLQLIAPIL
jgi:hypothetical protein